MTLIDFVVVVGGILAWLAFLVAVTAIVDAIGGRRIADFLRLDVGDEDER
jgi:hypothetical protein